MQGSSGPPTVTRAVWFASAAPVSNCSRGPLEPGRCIGHEGQPPVSSASLHQRLLAFSSGPAWKLGWLWLPSGQPPVSATHHGKRAVPAASLWAIQPTQLAGDAHPVQLRGILLISASGAHVPLSWLRPTGYARIPPSTAAVCTSTRGRSWTAFPSPFSGAPRHRRTDPAPYGEQLSVPG